MVGSIASSALNRRGDSGWPEGLRIDPWVAAIYRNCTESMLCGLPDHILIDIMQRLYLTSLCQLRRVSRCFVRLFASKTLAPYHKNSRRYRLLWPSPVEAPGFRKALAFGNETKSFCEACEASRFPGSESHRRATNLLYCSGCGKYHPASIFSAAERFKDSETRLCIGREGYIRLCEHRVFGWDEFVRVSSEKRQEAYITCDHANHGESTAPERPLSRVKAKFEYRRGNKPWASHVALLKKSHMPLSDDAPDRRSLIVADDVRQSLAKLRGRSPCLWYPEQGPRGLDPMGCFDPNLCSCLLYEGADLVPILTSPSQEIKQTPLHRCPRNSGIKKFRTRMECLITWQIHTEHTDVQRTTVWCFIHGFDRVMNTPHCIQVCHDRIFYAKNSNGDSKSLNPWSPQWYLALDPSSHNLTKDTEFRGVTWCEDDRCCNYHKSRQHASLGTMC